MSKTDSTTFTLPSNPADKKKIRDIFYEMAGLKQTIKDRQEDYKSYIEALQNDFGIPKKLIAKVAKIVYDHNFDEISEENSAIEYLYEGVMINSTTSKSVTDQDDELDSDA